MSRQPAWQKKGYKSPDEYRAACRANRKTKKAALLATKATNKALEVLRFIWDEAEFDKPICTFTQQQIMAGTRAGRVTVREAMRLLREEGSIKPIYMKGGRGIPSKYRLGVAGQPTTPSDEHLEVMEANRDREAAWRFLSAKYGPLKAIEILGDKPEN